MKRLLLTMIIAFCITFIISLAGCSSGNEDDSISIEGLWEINSMTIDSTTYTDPFTDNHSNWDNEPATDTIEYEMFYIFENGNGSKIIHVTSFTGSGTSDGPSVGYYYSCSSGDFTYMTSSEIILFNDSQFLSADREGNVLAITDDMSSVATTYSMGLLNDDLDPAPIEGFCDQIDDLFI